MKDVDYLKLSEQYASFLVAVGGVSITVLSIVLSLNVKSADGYSGSFLVAALIVATVACFVGAHMMAETAAFISYSNQKPVNRRPTGERLFLLASANIFIAVSLVLFSLMLLPRLSDKVDAARPISIIVFGFVLGGSFCWMILAAVYRMPVRRGGLAAVVGIAAGVLWGLFLCGYKTPTEDFLCPTFTPIVILTVFLLIYFALIFKGCGKTHPRTVYLREICFFSLAVTTSYASLVVASIKIVRGR